MESSRLLGIRNLADFYFSQTIQGYVRIEHRGKRVQLIIFAIRPRFPIEYSSLWLGKQLYWPNSAYVCRDHYIIEPSLFLLKVYELLTFVTFSFTNASNITGPLRFLARLPHSKAHLLMSTTIIFNQPLLASRTRSLNICSYSTSGKRFVKHGSLYVDSFHFYFNESGKPFTHRLENKPVLKSRQYHLIALHLSKNPCRYPCQLLGTSTRLAPYS